MAHGRCRPFRRLIVSLRLRGSNYDSVVSPIVVLLFLRNDCVVRPPGSQLRDRGCHQNGHEPESETRSQGLAPQISAVRSERDESAESETTHYEMTGALLSNFIDGVTFGLEAPSGLALVDDILFVTDNETSEIVAFDMDGEEVDRLNTGVARGSLMGLVAPSLDDLWLVSATENRVYRLQPYTR